MTFIIGVGCKARQGKDTLCQMMHELAPSETRIYAFADALYAHARCLGLMTRKDGTVLQLLGTDIYRRKDPDFWVKQLVMRIEDQVPGIAIITDMRFKNEHAWIKHNQGLTVRVTRRAKDGSQIVATDRPLDHPSEIDLDAVAMDRAVDVLDGDLKDMHNCAKTILDEAMWRASY